MFSRLTRTGIMASACAALLQADFSYEQTSQITGGAVAGMMKVAAAFSKQLREPVRTTVLVKGGRMLHGSPARASIIDVDKETITTIDYEKKTYSVMTFAEMQQAVEEMTKKMQSKGGEMNFKVSANPTGQTKQFAGIEAKELILKMEMEGTDQKSGQTGAMTIITNMWLAPKVAGYDEVTSLSQKMAQKLRWSPGGNPMMMQRPDIMKGMAEVYKEVAKLDGMPVHQVVKMGASAQEGAPGAATAPQTQPQQQAERPSIGGALGGALGGRLGGFGRKKPKPEEQPAQNQTAPAAQGDASGSLLEMTTETTGFSSAPVDSAKFEVPAGFKKVESDLRRMR